MHGDRRGIRRDDFHAGIHFCEVGSIMLEKLIAGLLKIILGVVVAASFVLCAAMIATGAYLVVLCVFIVYAVAIFFAYFD